MRHSSSREPVPRGATHHVARLQEGDVHCADAKRGGWLNRGRDVLTIMGLLRNLANSYHPDSFTTRLRRTRFALFRSLAETLPRPYTVLDVGGTEIFWEIMGYTKERDVSIVLLNLDRAPTSYPQFSSIIGDGRNMREFEDDQFDIVCSNSVIEHVGDLEDQRQMAKEITRVGKKYFVQTPNRYFPIEPHFLFPFFQFLPFALRVFLVRHFDLGWFAMGGVPDKASAEEIVRSIRLLTERELRQLFPDGTIYREKLLGLTKSFVVYRD